MGKINNELDLSLLPMEAKKELFNFYNLLKEKYTIKNKASKQIFNKYMRNPLKVDYIILPTKEELHAR